MTRQEIRTWDRLPFSTHRNPVMATRKPAKPARHIVRMLALVDILTIGMAVAALVNV